ncbi:MAG: glycosyltransferase [Candidatus Methanoperedens sp.]|nr:glycosyltransferase [Candidatus Methanoperedens sp.]
MISIISRILPQSIKEKIRLSNFWPFILEYKAGKLHKEYNRRREKYKTLKGNKQLSISIGNGMNSLKQHFISYGGWNRKHKKVGEIHTFAIVRRKTWEKSLADELKALGKVTIFDFYERGFDESIQTKRNLWLRKREEENSEIIKVLQETHKADPVDWVFCYFDGLFILRSTIETIKNSFNIPTVNMCLDDKHSWDGYRLGEQMTGQIALASVFDLSWTSARIAVDWYNLEGGRCIYLPEGFNPAEYYPTGVDFDIPVSFVGACYGARPLLINFLKKHGIPVQVFGSGWGREGSGYARSPNEIFNRSQINLGGGYIGHSMDLTNVKGRDFDIPGTGGGAYLTTFNSDLAQHYQIGKEILCYHSVDECLELVRHYLDRPEECRSMAKLARDRCLGEHRWLHRYIYICQLLGILDDKISVPAIIDQLK